MWHDARLHYNLIPSRTDRIQAQGLLPPVHLPKLQKLSPPHADRRPNLSAFPMRLLCAITVLAAFFVKLSRCQQNNTVTLDDTDPRITFSYRDFGGTVGKWIGLDAANQTTCGCVSGVIQATRTYYQTWHDGNDHADVVFDFYGTGVAPYLIIRDQLEEVTNLTFVIDGVAKGTYWRSGQGTAEFLYDVNPWNISGLENTSHQLWIQGGSPNWYAFDYLTYSFDSDDATAGNNTTNPNKPDNPHNSTQIPTIGGSNAGVVAGAAVAGVVGASVICSIGFWIFWRRNKRRSLHPIAPFDESPYTVEPIIFPTTSPTSQPLMLSFNTGGVSATPFARPLVSPPNPLTSGSSPLKSRSANRIDNSTTTHVSAVEDAPPAYPMSENHA